MEHTVKDNCIFMDGIKVSNFSILKNEESRYVLNNGTQIAECETLNTSRLAFRRQIERLGNYRFYGNKAQLEVLIHELNNPTT